MADLVTDGTDGGAGPRAAGGTGGDAGPRAAGGTGGDAGPWAAEEADGGAGPRAAEETAHPRAQRATVLGLLALVGGFFVLPLLLGPYAWWYGSDVRRAVDREPDRWTPGSRRAAATGAALGLAATVVLAVLVLLVVGLAVAAQLRLTEDTGY